MRTFRNPSEIHSPVGQYSHQVEVANPGRWLVLSGQVGVTKDGSIPTDAVEQFAISLDNVRLNIEAAGMALRNIIKLTMYLVGEIDNDRRREVLFDWLGNHQPCMTLLYVERLAAPELAVEIEALCCESANETDQ